MSANIEKVGNYVVLRDGTRLHTQKGYMVGRNGAGSNKNTAYVVGSIGGGFSKVQSQVVIANPAVVTANVAYVAFTHNRDANVLTAPSYAVIYPFYPPYEDLTLNYTFMERRFPECVSFGSSGGPGWKTSVFEFDSGFTADTIEWERLRARYEVNFENSPPEDLEEVENFFYGMKGRAIGFRYKDWQDYTIANQNFGLGDGVQTNFQVFKRYQSGGITFDRVISKTVATTSDISIDDGPTLLEGSDYFMLDALGQVVFTTPPPPGSIVKINYIEYDVPVRFDTDELEVSFDDFQQLNYSLPLVEVVV